MAEATEADLKAKAHARDQRALEKEALDRLEACRAQKAQRDLDLREGYFFTAPHRHRQVSSRTKGSITLPTDAGELNTSFAMECAGDFATVIINTFLPESEQWAEREAPSHLNDAEKASVNEQVRKADTGIFDAIGASNFYAECAKAFNPDLSLGTVAIWLTRLHATLPLHTQAIPLRELEINLGPYGDIDDRFVVRYSKYRFIEAVLPGLTLPAKIKRLAEKRPDMDCCIAWGFWRIYKNEAGEFDGIERWQHVVLIDGDIVNDSKLTGAGSCPVIVARFNAAPDAPFGQGPTLQALPDFRQMDYMEESKSESVDHHLKPAITWPDDSWANVEQGVEAGSVYQVRAGSAVDIKPIYIPPPLDPAIFITQDKEARVRRLFFLDYPTQPGKTPPTAAQWLDEMMMAQRRIGTPGLSFWDEFCRGTFQRVQYLLESAGTIKRVMATNAAGDKVPMNLLPYNPAKKALEQQLVAQFARFVQVASQAFPEEFKLWSDGKLTIDNLAKAMGVDVLWAKRSEGDIKAAMTHLQGLAGNQPGTAPAIPQGEPETPAPAGPQGNQPVFQLRGTDT